MKAEKRRAIERRLEALEKKHGDSFGPDVVVEDASDKTSPLHDQFEWNNKKAGHLYRIQQARTLLRTIKVTVRTETVEFRVPKYVRNPDADEKVQGYVETAKLRTDEERAVRAILYEMERLDAVMGRVQKIASAMGLHDYVAMLIDAAEILRGQVKLAA